MTKGEYDDILDQYKDWKIDKLRVVRRPLAGYQEMFAQGAQAFSGIGKKDHVDKFFHLYTEMALRHPETGERQVIKMEKNQTLKALDAQLGGVPEPAQGMAIDTSAWGKGGRTFGEYEARHLDHHVNVLGKSYHNYSVRLNNCQSWTTSGLDANGLSSAEAKSFVNQPLAEALPSWFGAFLQPLTDARAFVDKIIDKFRGGHNAKKTPISEHIAKAPPHVAWQPHRVEFPTGAGGETVDGAPPN